MIEKLNNFINYGIYTFEEINLSKENSSLNSNNYLKLELSRDKFRTFNSNIGNNIISSEIIATIYDEGIIRSHYDILEIQHLLKKLNKQKIKNIKFILSNETLPIYNHIMSSINWRHGQKTTITMKIDHNPISKEIRDWKLNEAVGKIELPEEKLIWVPDIDLNRINGQIDKNTLEETKKLKDLIIYLDNYLRKTYYTEYMTDFEKVQAIYDYININICYQQTMTKNRTTINSKIISTPYTVWKYKENNTEQLARLITILLNNPIIKIDATTITYKQNNQKQNWIGIVIKNKLYSYLPTLQEPFKNFEEAGYILTEECKTNQIYPSIYEYNYLTEKEINTLKIKLRKLKR